MAIKLAKDGDPSLPAANLAIEPMVNKFADAKVKAASADGLLDLIEGAGGALVIDKVVKLSSTHKSPKVLEEALMWMSLALKGQNF